MRAESCAPRASSSASPRAIRFHCSGLLSSQNRATSVWSAVRADGVVTPSPPRALISLRSRA